MDVARLDFLLELDKAKSVLRENPIADGSRRENDAEHMWHFGMAALLLTPPAIDRWRVVTMALVHDIVEIDAGDTIVYKHDPDKVERERLAADRLFGMFDGGAELRAVWEEFEEGITAEARFARALDRLLPVMLNHASHGVAWRRNGVTASQVRDVNAATVAASSPELWTYIQSLIDDSVARGYLDDVPG